MTADWTATTTGDKPLYHVSDTRACLTGQSSHHSSCLVGVPGFLLPLLVGAGAVHTDPSLGFFIVPRDIVNDEDFRKLSDAELRVWFHLLALCDRERQRIGRATLPPYSWVASEEDALETIQTDKKTLYEALAKLQQCRWIVVQHIRGLLVVTMTRARKWQKFETYRTTDEWKI
jgi:hypothetical protein